MRISSFGFSCLMLALSACDQPARQVDQAPIQLKIDGEVTEMLTGPLLSIRTNLPDETRLMATILGPSNQIEAQDQGVVHAGTVSFGPFTSLPPAQRRVGFSAEISASLTDIQPDNVRAKVSLGYSNYKSEFIVDGSVGKIIEYKFPLQ